MKDSTAEAIKKAAKKLNKTKRNIGKTNDTVEISWGISPSSKRMKNRLPYSKELEEYEEDLPLNLDEVDDRPLSVEMIYS
jgi:hypothetical protein